MFEMNDPRRTVLVSQHMAELLTNYLKNQSLYYSHISTTKT